MRCARELLEIGRPNSRESGGDLEGESERRGLYLYPLEFRARSERSNYLRIIARDSEVLGIVRPAFLVPRLCN